MTPLGTKLGRAFRRRCPRCGADGIWASWFTIAPRCPNCGLSPNRGEADYWIGAFTINFVAGEGLAAVLAIIVLAKWWPNTVPGTIVGITLAILVPLLFYPFAWTIWLALDLHFRPSEPGDT